MTVTNSRARRLRKLASDPASGADGDVYYNTTTDKIRTYNGSAWSDAGGSGTVGGSVGSTDNRLVRTDGTGGSTVQGSAVTVDDSGNMSGVGTLASGAQTITPGAANTKILSSTGYSLTGSDATNGIDIAGTWNTSGNPTLIKANVTNTASGSSSLLLDLQASTVSQFRVAKNGDLAIGSSGEAKYGFGADPNTYMRFSAIGVLDFFLNSIHTLRVNTTQIAMKGGLQFVSGTGDPFAGIDVGLGRATAKVWKITDGASAGGTISAPSTSASAITSDQNNYNPGGSSLNQRWSSDASRNITGLTFTAAQQDGQFHYIWNVGAQNIVLVNESASSTAANRFTTTTGADLTLAANKCALAIYDGTSARWRLVLLP